MAKSKPRVKVPKSAAAGEIIQIKTLISHKMETGLRKDKKGNVIPRMIINKFSCTLNGKVVFSADWQAGISANPYLAFKLKAMESGKLEFKWVDDDGAVYTKSADLKVG
jgi:sulfur-oxidizing protein SoxZ